MKILVIDNAIDAHSRRFMLMLLNAGHEVASISDVNNLPYQTQNFAYHPYPSFTWTYGIRPYRLGRMIRDFLAGLNLRRVWKHFKPDVTHVLLINPSAYHSALARIHPLVLTSFGSDINELFESKSQNFELRSRIGKTLRSADCITADASDVLQKCNELAKTQLNSKLFYFGIDLNLFKPASTLEKEKLRRILSISSKSKIILSPRRLIYKMRHDVVLKAFAEVLKRKRLDAVLVLRKYGSFSVQCESELKNLAVELNIADRLLWVDQLDYEMMPILNSLSDLVVNVPEQDALPVALFEASACMTPVITSDLPSYREFLAEGSYSRVSAGDANQLANKYQYVLDQRDNEANQELQKNYDLVARKASEAKCLYTVEQIYRRLI